MPSRHSPSAWLTGFVWLAIAVIPMVLGEWALAQFAQFLTYGIFALALGFLWGHAGILSLGQAIFFGIGAYSMALVSLGMLPGIPASVFYGFAMAVVISGSFAAILGAVLFYGRGLSGAYFGVATLCGAVILEMAAGRWDYIGGNNGLFGIPPLSLPAAAASLLSDPAAQFLIAFSASLAVYLFLLWLTRTPFGTVVAAIRDNDKRAAFLGFNVPLHRTTALVLSAMISAFAGALFATSFGFVSPTLIGAGLSTEVLIWVAVGGRGVLMAAFLGAMLVRTAESVLSERFGSYWLLVLGAVFVVVVVFFPKGVFGRLLALRAPGRLRIEPFAQPAAVDESAATPAPDDPPSSPKHRTDRGVRMSGDAALAPHQQ